MGITADGIALDADQRDQIRFMHQQGGWDVFDIASRLRIERDTVIAFVDAGCPAGDAPGNVTRVEGFG